jgi:phenylacetate-coenzyme A ligase PaaK-like adenylate-forming protein
MSSSFDFPFVAGLDAARWVQAGLEVWEAWRMTPAQLAASRQQRLASMLRHARAASPFYRELHAGLPLADDAPLSAYPTVDKRTLMHQFDRVSTRPEVTLHAIERFVSRPERHGSLFQGRYAVWTSSGTTGQPGWFVQDPGALAVYDALEAQRFRGVGLARSWLPGERYAMVAATGGHFAGVSSVERMRRSVPWLAPFVRSCSLMQPVQSLVAELNAFQPAIVATYPTAAEMLAEEQASGRLRLRLREVWTGGECLAPATRARLQSVFGCPVRNSYGASEFLPLAWECDHLNLHVNSDWVILEPVDAEQRPVAPGTRSRSVLLTNLANRVQPIIRYDLGDSVLERPDPCPCGNPLPAIRVQGRAADVLTFEGRHGDRVSVAPLAFGIALDRITAIEQFQIVQTEPMQLAVRLRYAASADKDRAWPQARAAIGELLSARGLARVTVSLDNEPPAQGAGAKFRQVIPYPQHGTP